MAIGLQFSAELIGSLICTGFIQTCFILDEKVPVYMLLLNITQSGFTSAFAFNLITLAEILPLPVALLVFSFSRRSNSSFLSTSVNIISSQSGKRSVEDFLAKL